ncbi:kinase-like protein [Pluteus cervinus]|uniref:Kinase-like protein n=1 Tax=Pluteus cervinus TaxID=181527 RepID=A0ACD3BGQ1_9AGAR|nr:kinase-like protein [Pluteus cervinus]
MTHQRFAPSTTSLGGPSKMPTSRSFIGAVEDEWQMYSDRAEDYAIGATIGFGASSIVYAATYQPQPTLPSLPLPPPVPCALKVLDLDSLPPRALALLQRETTLMSLSKHPNVLRVRGSWMDGHKLYIALRLMNSGSAADVMRYGWPGGMEEDVVRCILSQALQGLNYLHINDFIHRDIKAANLLIDDDGTVLLGDLGVAADLTEDASSHPAPSRSLPSTSALTDNSRHIAFHSTGPTVSRPKIGKRKSFVGTPCWMAPELIQGKQYDSSADIWSFGITALELAQGRPPRSRENPQRVLLRIVQEAPPTLDREGGTYKYSKAFKEMVESCLVKDPTKRPTAEDLLQSPFFKAAKKKNYLVGAILKDLPPLAQRQERRLVHHSQNSRSLDSWDFATTIQSMSTYRRKIYSGDAVFEVPDITDDVFEMEGDLLTQGKAGSQSPRSDKSHPDELSDTEEPQIQDTPLSSSLPLSEISSSSSPSSGSTPLTDCTPPSSVGESPILPVKNRSNLREQSTSGQSRSDGEKPSLSQPKESADGTSGSIGREGSLWKKFKSATRRSASRASTTQESEELFRTSSRIDRIGQKVFNTVTRKRSNI